MSDFFSNLLSGIDTPAGATSLAGGALSLAGNLGAAAIKSNALGNAQNTITGAANTGEGFIDTGVNQVREHDRAADDAAADPAPAEPRPDHPAADGRDEPAAAERSRAGGVGTARRGLVRHCLAREQQPAVPEAQARAANDASNLAAQQQAANVQNQARTGLANVQAAAGTAKANTAIGAGSQIAGLQGQQGVAQGAGLTSAVGNITPTLGALSAYGANPNSAAANLTAQPSVTAQPAATATVPVAALGGDPNSGGYGLPAGSYGTQPANGMGGTFAQGSV